MEETVKKKRIGNVAAVFLVGTAVIVDLATLIPFVGDFAGPIFWGLASLYFWKAGMGLLNGKRLAATGASIVIEIIPFVQWVPSITLGILAIIAMSRVEDKTGISLSPLTKGKALNSNGVRAPSIDMGAKPPPVNVDGVRGPTR